MVADQSGGGILSEFSYLVEFRQVGERRWIQYGLESSPTTINYLDDNVTYEVRVTVFGAHGHATTTPRRATTRAP